ncbi:hypothetical protein J7E79_28305 [Bacillus sp. ISL-40]|uniref:hypothetical protein n=1 Tax=unclassified Bacillus (in: firmicutes) TaxID=185979 RepID=UPI001BE99BB4|nr:MULTISPECIES: hypothetical protein [unclassified Bacillus (in: firmicutes)]MBT2701189.1 hypothetical protein [Bacillus sp. ISL-40]MBT2722638.1 hypothetical protein [Bacillus sp. ISL-46]MBT2744450.1 hypothetical protein [Bacillus sp. ISL-77]
MSMKNKWLFNIAMVLLSWITVSFLERRSIKRFFPAFIFVFIINCIDVPIGKKRRWWSFYNNPHSFFHNEFPFLIGPMLAVALWTLKWTYGNFKKFILLNALFQLIFTFLAKNLFAKIKLFKLVRLNAFQFFLYFFYKAFFLYGFQYIYENKKRLFN